MIKKKVTMSWSGGKDSAFALYKILLAGEFEVVNLHTVIDEQTKRVGLHGVQESLIEQQAECLGLPLLKIYLPASDNHDAYERIMRTFYADCAQQNIQGVVFGDIFLEDLKVYREKMLKDSNLIPEFPLWKMNTKHLLNDFLNKGFKTIVCSANAALFDIEQMGTTIDDSFSSSLKAGVDCCGENGEFHTLVYDGPIFNKPLRFEIGEVIKKSYVYQIKNEGGAVEKMETSFWFQDLVPRTE